jgi:type IV pilus assembly protein PilC
MSTDPEGILFYFRAGAPEGGVFAGQLRSKSPEEALAQLRDKGFQPLRLELQPIRDSWLQREVGLGRSKRLSTQDCEELCRELALLLESGIAVLDAVTITQAAQRAGSRLAKCGAAVGSGLRLGRSLSQAIESSGFSTPSDLLPIVRAGEQSGSLGVALRMLAGSYAENNRFARASSSALAYPALLLCVSLMVFGLIGFFVAPNLSGFFLSMDRPVPAAIAALAAIADFFRENMLPVGAVAIGLCITIGLGGANSALSRAAAATLFRTPVVGSAMRWDAGRRFAAALQLYLSSNVPMATALPNALLAGGFPGGSEAANHLASKIREGERLSISLSGSKLLPTKLVQMISVGESSGRLVDVLGAVVTEAKSRFEQRMSLVSTLLAPLLILVVGAVIGTVIFSVFSALLEINEVAL